MISIKIHILTINVWSECGSQVQVPVKEGNAALHRAQWRGGKHDDHDDYDDHDQDDQDDEETDDGDGKDRECWESNLISQLRQKTFSLFLFFPYFHTFTLVLSYLLFGQMYTSWWVVEVS